MSGMGGLKRRTVAAAVLGAMATVSAIAVMLLGAAPAQADYGGGPPPPTTTTVLVLGSTLAPSVSTTVAPTTVAPTTTAPATVLGTIAAPPPVTTVVKPSLAFTGADVAGLVAIALVLLVIGFGLRTAGRRRHQN